MNDRFPESQNDELDEKCSSGHDYESEDETGDESSDDYEADYDDGAQDGESDDYEDEMDGESSEGSDDGESCTIIIGGDDSILDRASDDGYDSHEDTSSSYGEAKESTEGEELSVADTHKPPRPRKKRREK